MDALDQSDALMRRSDKLRARSMRIRAAAGEKMAKSELLIAAAHEAVMRAHGGEPAGREGVRQQVTCPQADRTVALSAIVCGW